MLPKPIHSKFFSIFLVWQSGVGSWSITHRRRQYKTSRRMDQFLFQKVLFCGARALSENRKHTPNNKTRMQLPLSQSYSRYCRLRIYWITDVRDVFKSFIHFFDVFHLIGKAKSHVMIRGVVQKRRIFGRSGLNPLCKIYIIAVTKIKKR